MSEEFPWLSLDPDEAIAWSGSPRPHVVAPVALGAIALVAVALLAVPQWWIGVAAALVGAAAVAVALLYVRNVTFVVSTSYLYAKRGVLGRAVTQIGLQNVQDATLKQGVFGTQFGHGTISFSTAGGAGDELRMYAIADPTAVKSTVDEQVAAARRRGRTGGDRAGSTATPTDETGDVAAVLSEARALREVAQRLENGRSNGASTSATTDRGDRS